MSDVIAFVDEAEDVRPVELPRGRPCPFPVGWDDRHAAEDLLQNAQIKAAGRWHRIDEPKAYVRQILHRQQVNRWRLKWPRRELSVPEPLESPVRQDADDGPGAADLRIVTDDRAVAVRTYRLLDQKTGKYVKTTKWSFIDVAPGMRTAAVLEKDLPAKRIGLLNLLTGEVERWIPVDRGVAGVEFSPDGSKLVATTYSTNPDLRYKADYDCNGDGKKNDWMPQYGQSNRTGFYVIDVDSGKGSWSEVTYNSDDLNVRQDFAFSHEGKLVYSGLTTDPTMQYYDFEGNEVSKPANEHEPVVELVRARRDVPGDEPLVVDPGEQLLPVHLGDPLAV